MYSKKSNRQNSNSLLYILILVVILVSVLIANTLKSESIEIKKRSEALKIIDGLMNEKDELINFRERTKKLLSIKKESKNQDIKRLESLSKIESILVDI